MKNNSYYTNFRPEIISLLPNTIKTILDVGTGEGFFLKSVKEKIGAETWGIEVVAEVAKEAEVNVDRILIGKIEDMVPKLPDNYFDCITFNDVLEHTVEPGEILAILMPKLSNNGVILASIPNVRYFFNLRDLIFKKDWEYTDAGILDSTHYRFFTEKSMRRLFLNAGYEILLQKGVNKIQSWKFLLFNCLTFGFFRDTQYLQFVCIVKRK